MRSAPKSKLRLPEEVARNLGPYYVYLLLDPRTERPFYVGKGSGQRLTEHGNAVDAEPERGETEKSARIRKIRARGKEPEIQVVRHGIDSEQHALEIEAALIDTLPGLVNLMRGQDIERGKRPLEELLRLHGAPVLRIRRPLLLIRLGNWEGERDASLGRHGLGFKYGMSLKALYGSTRGWWRVSPDRVRRTGIRHAVAVYKGVTRAIFTINGWLRATPHGRHAFSGSAIEDGPIWDQVVGPLGHRVPVGQNPVYYWPRA